MKIDKYIEEGSIDYKDDRIIILKQINDVKEVASSPIKAEWFIAIPVPVEEQRSTSITNSKPLIRIIC